MMCQTLLDTLPFSPGSPHELVSLYITDDDSYQSIPTSIIMTAGLQSLPALFYSPTEQIKSTVDPVLKYSLLSCVPRHKEANRFIYQIHSIRYYALETYDLVSTLDQSCTPESCPHFDIDSKSTFLCKLHGPSQSV